MTNLPTDLKILEAIYECYYSDFQAYSEKNKTRSSKIYVPINIEELAKSMGVDIDIIFGRLYYHLDEKYKYKQDDRSTVHFFTPVAGQDKNCVNFPYLASVLAKLKDENRRYLFPLLCSIATIAIAIAAVIISIVK